MTLFYRIGEPFLEVEGDKWTIGCPWSAWENRAEFPFAKDVVSTDYRSEHLTDINNPTMLRSLMANTVEIARYRACEALLKRVAPKPAEVAA